MLLRIGSFLLLPLLLLAGMAALLHRTPVAAQAQEICFPEQPGLACLQAPFAGYWQGNGGLPVFGYPVAPATNERAETGDVLLTQWTERNRLEYHPANAAPYDVLLGRMGAERLAQLGRDPFAEGREAGALPGCLWFEETGHNVCDQLPGLGFKSYWEANGLADPRLNAYQRSLALFGLPLTAAQVEVSVTDGRVYLTQWFERARFEWHPQNPDPYKVLLGLLGNELRTANTTPPALPATAPASMPGVTTVGVEINRNHASYTTAPASTAGASWVRYNGILWPEVEAVPGERNWAALATVDQELQAFSAAGLTPMVIVRHAPEWARSVPTSACSPIAPAALDEFAAFLGDLVRRYSAPPYNVRYWELGNEPDVDPALVDPSLPFGCWGNAADPYYGGGYYAEMLKVAYPAIKAADPQAQVVVGGLLLDCDPTNPPVQADGSRKDCTPARFLEGILRNGGGNYFDVVGYHSYTYWSAAFDPDTEHPSWAHRGGSLLGKADFLRSTMQAYGVNKPLLANEIGLLCYGDPQPCREFGFYGDQAIYLAKTYTRAAANGIHGAAWYTLNGPGWRLGGLVPRRGEPVPAYSTLFFVGNLLDRAQLEGRVGTAPLEGYSFRKGNARYQVLWATQPGAVVLRLPQGTRTVYDLYGNGSAPQGSSISIGKQPVVLEIR